MASSTAAATSPFLGTRLPEHSVAKAVGRFQARFGFGSKKSRPKKAKAPPTSDQPLWFPGAKAPEWLDGSLVGDYGFDPFRLGKPVEYLQFDFDSLDQNLAKNPSGDVIGTRTESADVKSTPFQSYPEVFGLQRFRECELIHGRRRDQTTTPSRQNLPSRCPLREDRPDQTVRIGSELPKRERRELVDPLLENADVFIWSPADMPAVDPEVAQHHLSISPEVRPVKQRPRQFVPE